MSLLNLLSLSPYTVLCSDKFKRANRTTGFPCFNSCLPNAVFIIAEVIIVTLAQVIQSNLCSVCTSYKQDNFGIVGFLLFVLRFCFYLNTEGYTVMCDNFNNPHINSLFCRLLFNLFTIVPNSQGKFQQYKS